MSQLHFVGGEKGGVGKSMVSRILAQYFIDHDLPFTGYDSDRSHGALMRFYAGYASPVVIDDYANLDRVVEAAAVGGSERVLVDLAAQTHHALMRWMDDSGLIELAPEAGLSITYWHVMDAGRDSVDLLKRLLDTLGGRVGIVLVLNALRGDRFEILDASGERERALALGARVMTLGHLDDGTVQKIDARDSSFWAALNTAQSGGAPLGLLERQRVKVWLNRAYEQIARIAP